MAKTKFQKSSGPGYHVVDWKFFSTEKQYLSSITSELGPDDLKRLGPNPFVFILGKQQDWGVGIVTSEDDNYLNIKFFNRPTGRFKKDNANIIRGQNYRTLVNKIESITRQGRKLT